jgi:Luciferase-like monooxygenase/Hemerythrin HHE cation binding domain
MADYGHELQFGTFITPLAAQADRVLALAELTEQVGLDLVTVQDHPYQPRFLDAWTLLTAIATRTSRVTVAPNVANLPLRPPSVLARSVASLDILSGGRVELGLGAGAFWDAIAANGGPRRAPGEAVDALAEAIEVIRALWSDERGGARMPGSYYPLDGAKRGPAPVHDVGIWLGALKPRMLRLTGRLADGWWVSAGYTGLENLVEMNRVIDEAAEKAGRTGADIRRVYNVGGVFDAAGNGFLQGPQKLWTDQLTDVALEHGTSVFVLASDDPDDIRRFADVAAGVREQVAAARTTDARPSRTPAQTADLDVVPTPDDGTRLSTERLWDESARPTGPAPDPGQTYSAAGRAGPRQLIDVHDHLRSELEQIRDLVRQVAAGRLDPAALRSELNQMTLRQNNWTLGAYCESYCRLVATHHTLEDQAMLPQLKAADPRLGPVVDRLTEEHGVIHDVLERVDRALVSLVSEPDGMTDLQNAVDLLTDTLLSHLSYEERELVEPLARLQLL